jgi:predicted RNA binding protein YcfA (HicA-like mRNA interferase family)
MTYREVVKILKADGWEFCEQKGSHAHFIHPKKKGRVTIPNHGGKDLKPGTLANIWRQAGLDP